MCLSKNTACLSYHVFIFVVYICIFLVSYVLLLARDLLLTIPIPSKYFHEFTFIARFISIKISGMGIKKVLVYVGSIKIGSKQTT